MRVFSLFFLAAFLVLGNFSFPDISYGADASNVPVAKIGVVDMQTIATDSDAAKAAKEQLEAKYGKERAALEKRGDSLKKQAEGLKNPKQKGIEDKRAAFIKAKQKLDNDTRNFLRKVEQDEVKLRQDMVTLVFNAAYEVAKAKGYNFIVDVTAAGILYADPAMELTQDVLEEVNKLYKEKNPAAPAPEQKESEDKAAPKN